MLNCDISNYYSASAKEQQLYFEVESTMINQDKLTHETYAKKNELEAYVYLIKDQIGSKLKDFVLDVDAQRLVKECEVLCDWLYNDGAKTVKSEYAKRLDALKVLGDPIFKRYNDFINTPEAVKELLRVVLQAEQFAQTKVIHHIYF